MSPSRVVVVGAGLSGLVAAGRLRRAGREVVVLDKGRGPGGRLATRRLDEAGEAVADHGAQFFTVRSPEFAALMADWPVRVWHHGAVTADSITADPSTAQPGGDGHPRFVADAGMNAIAKHLAADLEVRAGAKVVAVRPGRDRVEAAWQVVVEGGTALEADAVLVTAPVPQAATMVEVPLPTDVTALRYDPCLGLLAVLDGPSGIPAPGALQLRGGPVNHVADNQGKGVSSRPTLTVHASGDWSTEAYEDSDAQIADALEALVRPWLTASVVSRQVKRWRYATPVNPHARRAVQVADGLVLAGDAFGGPKVEGAALSGLAAADLLLA